MSWVFLGATRCSSSPWLARTFPLCPCRILVLFVCPFLSALVGSPQSFLSVPFRFQPLRLSCRNYPAASASLLGCLVKLVGVNGRHSTFARTAPDAPVLETEVRLLPFLSGVVRLDSRPTHGVACPLLWQDSRCPRFLVGVGCLCSSLAGLTSSLVSCWSWVLALFSGSSRVVLGLLLELDICPLLWQNSRCSGSLPVGLFLELGVHFLLQQDLHGPGSLPVRLSLLELGLLCSLSLGLFLLSCWTGTFGQV
jgi:hypothetical protein